MAYIARKATSCSLVMQCVLNPNPTHACLCSLNPGRLHRARKATSRSLIIIDEFGKGTQ